MGINRDFEPEEKPRELKNRIAVPHLCQLVLLFYLEMCNPATHALVSLTLLWNHNIITCKAVSKPVAVNINSTFLFQGASIKIKAKLALINKKVTKIKINKFTVIFVIWPFAITVCSLYSLQTAKFLQTVISAISVSSLPIFPQLVPSGLFAVLKYLSLRLPQISTSLNSKIAL